MAEGSASAFHYFQASMTTRPRVPSNFVPVSDSIDYQLIQRVLSDHQAQEISLPDAHQAAVAIVTRFNPVKMEMLFIKRAAHPQDPWSGQMAFPGGRRDPGDTDIQAAAEREVLEELNLPLQRCRYLGRFDDMHGRFAGKKIGLVISSFVYCVQGEHDIRPNYEVEQALWVPLSVFLDRDARVAHRHPLNPRQVYPGVRVGDQDDYVVWGLTFRFVSEFLKVLGCPVPEPLPEVDLQ